MEGQFHRHVFKIRLKSGSFPDFCGLCGDRVASHVVQGAAIIKVGVSLSSGAGWASIPILSQLIDHILCYTTIFVQLPKDLGVATALYVLPDHIDVFIALRVVFGEGRRPPVKINRDPFRRAPCPQFLGENPAPIAHWGGSVEGCPRPVPPKLELHCGAVFMGIVVLPHLSGCILGSTCQGKIKSPAAVGSICAGTMIGRIGIVIGDGEVILSRQIQLCTIQNTVLVLFRHPVGELAAIQVIPPGVIDLDHKPRRVLCPDSFQGPRLPCSILCHKPERGSFIPYQLMKGNCLYYHPLPV